jgi:hypothetical protein
LLQQAFRTHGGFDGIENDADARRELRQEREMRGGKLRESRQLDHGFGFALE